MANEENKKRMREELRRKGFIMLTELEFNRDKGIYAAIVKDKQNRKFAIEIKGGLHIEDCLMTLLESDNPQDNIGETSNVKLSDIPDAEIEGADETSRMQAHRVGGPKKIEVEAEIPAEKSPAESEALLPRRPQTEEQMPLLGKVLSEGMGGMKVPEMHIGVGTGSAGGNGSTRTTQRTQRTQTTSTARQKQGQDQETVRQSKEKRKQRSEEAQKKGYAGENPAVPEKKAPEGPSMAKRALKYAVLGTAGTLGGAIGHVLFLS